MATTRGGHSEHWGKGFLVGIAREVSLCVWMLFSLHFFLSSPITDTRESKGTNTGGYRHYTLEGVFLTLDITSCYQPVK